MVTEVVATKGVFSRVADSFFVAFVGFFFVVGSVPLLFWNEGRAVHRARVLEVAERDVVSLPTPTVVPAHEGRLVHASGPVTNELPLVDPAIGLAVPALRYERVVEMVQWVERSESRTSTQVGGSQRTRTTYRYELAWSEEPVDASAFREAGHVNPPMPLRSLRLDAPLSRFGDFALAAPLLSRLDGFAPIVPTPAQAAALSQQVGRPLTAAGFELQAVAVPNQLSLGDLRIRLRQVPSGIVATAVGAQRGRTLGDYPVGDDALEPNLRPGTLSAAQFIHELADENTAITYILRVLFFLLAWLGFASILRPFKVAADVLPFVGQLASVGIGLVSFALSSVLSTVTVAVGWIVYRPLVGLGLLAVAGAIGFGLTRMRPKTA